MHCSLKRLYQENVSIVRAQTKAKAWWLKSSRADGITYVFELVYSGYVNRI
jgi:hypothetical protein